MSVGKSTAHFAVATPECAVLAECAVLLNDRGGSVGMSSGRSAALFDRAKTIRSKNLGVDRITFILIFADRTACEPMRRSGALPAHGYSA